MNWGSSINDGMENLLISAILSKKISKEFRYYKEHDTTYGHFNNILMLKKQEADNFLYLHFSIVLWFRFLL
jgi:hypothetical protein